MPAPNAREQAALDWFSRCDRGLSPEQEAEFETWLAADPTHAALFNEMAGTWNLLGRGAAATVLAPPAVPAAPTHRLLRAWALSCAAAAAIALAYVGYWHPAHYSGEITTQVGGLRTLNLPDGTLVALNTDSVLAADFSPAERLVRLERGEAHFTVARNPARPFIVEAGGVSVRAVGTAFNVRLDDHAIEVLVTEGRVRVDDAVSGHSLLAHAPDVDSATMDAFGAPVLTANQKVVVARPAPAARVEAVLPASAGAAVSSEEVRRELAWREGRLEFELAPLRGIVAEFNRYNRHQLAIADPDLAAKCFGGSFRSDDPAGFVRMLHDNYGVRVEETESASILRAAR